MIGRGGPTLVAVHSPISGGQKGIKCCCCMCCTCFNWNFLKTPHGILKIAEAMAAVSDELLLNDLHNISCD